VDTHNAAVCHSVTTRKNLNSPSLSVVKEDKGSEVELGLRRYYSGPLRPWRRKQ